MCIIVAKPKGVTLPTKRTLQQCFTNNDDGCGFMYVDKGKVVINKGYMSFGKFYKRLKELKRQFNSDLTDMALVFHFRIGTAGENSPQNTHPYPITMDVDKMKKLYLTTDLGIVHNGIIHDYNPTSTIDIQDDMNDTQCFIRDYVAEFKNLTPTFYKNDFVKQQILLESCDNKFAILDSKEDITIIGKFENVDGVFYSNSSYEKDYYYGYTSYTYSNGYKAPTSSKNKDKVANPYYELGGEYIIELDYDSMDEADIFDAIDRGELKFVNNNLITNIVIGGSWGYQDLGFDYTYMIDRSNNIYILDEKLYTLDLQYLYNNGENTLFDKHYQELDFYDFT